MGRATLLELSPAGWDPTKRERNLGSFEGEEKSSGANLRPLAHEEHCRPLGARVQHESKRKTVLP